jgi:hypothetical protein
MNYRERIRKAIECPQFGNERYGEWGALNLEKRILIKRLLDELDRADNYVKRLYLGNQELKKQLEETNRMIEKCGFVNIEQLMLSYCGLIAQQKEFIKWLEDYLNLFDYRDIEEQAGYDMLEEILQKYKETIGGKNE